MKHVWKPLVHDEIVSVVPEWARLEPLHDEYIPNKVELHSLIVTYLTFHDYRLEAFTPKQVNTLLWAALLHDISKRNLPEFYGKDHIHPFTSARAVLKIFYRYGIL